MMVARHTCFCGALRSEMIALSRWRSARVNVHDNSCSHDKSLNCFGQFGNRTNESEHYAAA